jgi:hypothetical protein
MTVNSTTRQSRQLGNGTTKAFSANIKIFAETDIVVHILTRTTSAVEKTLVLNDAGSDGYTVTFDLDDETLTVTCVTAPTATQDILINRSVPITQTQDYPKANKFPSQATENGLDKLTAIVQDNQSDLDRSIKVSTSDTSVDGTLSSISGNAGKAIVVNSGEDGFDYREVLESETLVNFNKYTFNGDGSTTVFTLPQSIATQNALEVYVVDTGESLRQEPNVDFTASGTTLTFTTAPASGTGNIWVVDAATSTSASVPADGSVTEDKIVDSAVTLEKIENIASYKAVANVTGSSASPSEVDILDEDDMSSDSNQALATQQSIKGYVDGVNSRVLLETQTASNDATIEFDTGIDGTYDKYLLEIISMRATDGEALYLRTSSDGGTSFDAGSSDYGWGYDRVTIGNSTPTIRTASADSAIELSNSGSLGFGAGESLNASFTLYDPSNSALNTIVGIQLDCYDTSGDGLSLVGTGTRSAASLVDAVQFSMSSGNITSGTFKLYGLK